MSASPIEVADRVLENTARQMGYAVAEAAGKKYGFKDKRVSLTLHELAGLVNGGFIEGAKWQQKRVRNG